MSLLRLACWLGWAGSGWLLGGLVGLRCLGCEQGDNMSILAPPSPSGNAEQRRNGARIGPLNPRPCRDWGDMGVMK